MRSHCSTFAFGSYPDLGLRFGLFFTDDRLVDDHSATRGLQGGLGWTIGKTNSGLVRVSRPKELPLLEGQRDMRPKDSAGATSPDSEGKRLAALARTNHSCARSH